MRCIICGSDDMDAKKLYCFPANLQKSRKWQESLGIKFSGETLRGRRICDKHFSPDSFKDKISFELKSDAVPKRWIISTELTGESGGCSSEISFVEFQRGNIEKGIEEIPKQDKVSPLITIVEETSCKKDQEVCGDKRIWINSKYLKPLWGHSLQKCE